MPEDIRKEVEDELKNAEKVLAEGNAEEVKREIEVLSKKVEKIGTAIYQQVSQAQAQAPGQGGTHEGNAGERIHDANYEEK